MVEAFSQELRICEKRPSQWTANYIQPRNGGQAAQYNCNRLPTDAQNY